MWQRNVVLLRSTCEVLIFSGLPGPGTARTSPALPVRMPHLRRMPRVVRFHHLPILRARESAGDRRDVGAKPSVLMSGVPGCAPCPGAVEVPLADFVAKNQLRPGVQRGEDELAPDVLIPPLLAPEPAVLVAHVGPDFVALNRLRRDLDRLL